MSRRLLVAGNWKMHKTVSESVQLAQALAQGLNRDDLDVLVCPTDLALHAVAQALTQSSIQVGGQNLFWEAQGAYTGEISAQFLLAAGATQVLVGHSERRQYFGETEKTALKRVKAALVAGLKPILCVGETLDERNANQTAGVLESQLAGGLAGLSPEDLASVAIAYEPVWAIGTGVTASLEQAAESHAVIRAWLCAKYNKEVANLTRILYGGSVKPENASALMGHQEIDGVLVGGASLTADSFLGIIQAA